MVEVQDITSIDVSQTTFPRNGEIFPSIIGKPPRLFTWWNGCGGWLAETGRPHSCPRTMDGRKRPGPHFSRPSQRPHAADLAARRRRKPGPRLRPQCGPGELITRNPNNGASGVEIRSRDLDLEATGRMNRATDFSATGWRTDADSFESFSIFRPAGGSLPSLARTGCRRLVDRMVVAGPFSPAHFFDCRLSPVGVAPACWPFSPSGGLPRAGRSTLSLAPSPHSVGTAESRAHGGAGRGCWQSSISWSRP